MQIFFEIMINIIWAIPGGGKSYIGTYIAVKELEKTKSKKSVYSNYPIILKTKHPILKRILNKIPYIEISRKGIKLFKREPLQDTIQSTNIWESKYIYSGLTNAVIILDEAYRDFSSKESYAFTKDKHTFFATNRHNDLDIYIIAQHPSRIEVTIREMANIFLFVSKWINPITGNPLWFDVSGYLSEEDFKLRNMKTDMRFSHQRVMFTKKVGNAYDTKFYRKEVIQSPQRWQDVNQVEYFKIKEQEKIEQEKVEESLKPVKNSKRAKNTNSKQFDF